MWIEQLSGRLQDVDVSWPIYRCLQCVGVGIWVPMGLVVFMLNTMDNLELVDKFCYLSDMLGKEPRKRQAQKLGVFGENSMGLRQFL